jgi:hypothetical protein
MRNTLIPQNWEKKDLINFTMSISETFYQNKLSVWSIILEFKCIETFSIPIQIQSQYYISSI